MKKLTEKQEHDLSEILLFIDNTYSLYKIKFNASVDCASGAISEQKLEFVFRRLIIDTIQGYIKGGLKRVAMVTMQQARQELMAEYKADYGRI